MPQWKWASSRLEGRNSWIFSRCGRCSRLSTATSWTRSGGLRKGQSPCGLSGIWGAQAREDGSQDAFLLERHYLCQLPVSVGGSVSLGTYWTGYFNYTWMGRFLFQWTDVFLCLLSCLPQAQPGLPEKERCLAWTIIFWLWRSSWTSSRVGLF